MGRNNNSAMNGVINAKYDNASPRRRSEMDNNERNKPGNNIKDPVRCPLCSAVLMCPRNKDYDEFIDGKLVRCMTSSDPGCKAATSRQSNQEYLARVQMRVKKLHDSHSNSR